jgi:hypothetical protein
VKTLAGSRIRGPRRRGHERRLYFAARHWFYALDAHWPAAPRVRARRAHRLRGLRRPRPAPLTVGLNTPGVFRDLMIVGSIA